MMDYSFYAGFFLWAATDSMMKKFRPFEPSHAKWTDKIRSRLSEAGGVKVDVLKRG
jgi:hypothetical protein